jgi:adenylosuccinate synthase
MMMKGDVLSGFETLKVCTDYNYKGENSTFLITSNRKTQFIKNFKGWKADLTGMTTYEELPIELKSILSLLKRSSSH